MFKLFPRLLMALALPCTAQDFSGLSFSEAQISSTGAVSFQARSAEGRQTTVTLDPEQPTAVILTQLPLRHEPATGER